MDERVQRWRGLGWAYWIVFGVIPICAGLMVSLNPHSNAGDLVEFLFSASLGVSVLLAVLVVPERRPWIWGVVAIVWFAGLLFWQPMLADLYFRVDYARMSSKYGTPLNVVRARHEIHNYWAALTTMTVSAGLAFALTRSWRSFALVVVPIVLLLCSRWVSHFIEAAIILWLPLFAGALVLWAFPKRIRPFPAHACQSCGYDLRGLESDSKCPECGSRPC